MREGNIMTRKQNAATDIPAARRPTAFGARAPTRRHRRTLLSLAVLATVGALVMLGTYLGHAGGLTNCAAAPGNCSFPDAANSGVPAGTTLKQVPSQVSSGPGWSFSAANHDVVVNVNGTVLSDLYIPYNLRITASNVTVRNVQVVAGGNFGISLVHTAGVTIENSTINGTNSTNYRVGSAIADLYLDSTGMVIKDDNIYNFRTGIQISTGLISGNYIHDPGFRSGDHTNGIYVNGGTQPLTISGNTIFDKLDQTDAINLDAGTPGPSAPVANKTITDNFLAGGGYTIYGGAASGSPTSNLKITGNRFGQNYYSKSGQYGPVIYFNAKGSGSSWSGNTWDTTGQTVATP
jgi:hypothetical protein